MDHSVFLPHTDDNFVTLRVQDGGTDEQFIGPAVRGENMVRICVCTYNRGLFSSSSSTSSSQLKPLLCRYSDPQPSLLCLECPSDVEV